MFSKVPLGKFPWIQPQTTPELLPCTKPQGQKRSNKSALPPGPHGQRSQMGGQWDRSASRGALFGWPSAWHKECSKCEFLEQGTWFLYPHRPPRQQSHHPSQTDYTDLSTFWPREVSESVTWIGEHSHRGKHRFLCKQMRGGKKV